MNHINSQNHLIITNRRYPFTFLKQSSYHQVERDLNFAYTEADSIQNELAEFYSYSELDDFAVNYTRWKIYADKNQVLFFFILVGQGDSDRHWVQSTSKGKTDDN